MQESSEPALRQDVIRDILTIFLICYFLFGFLDQSLEIIFLKFISLNKLNILVHLELVL